MSVSETPATVNSRGRTWPLPARPWSVRMIWHDLLFAHWPVSLVQIAKNLPRGVTLDTFQGQAWLGIVPFRMSGIRPRCLPALPRLSAFPELNVRTYVVVDHKPGVWFLTLDATSRLAVRGARRFFHLPYRDARIQAVRQADGWIDYHSQRCDRAHPPAEFAARYRPLSQEISPAERPFADWLTARYCLYSADPLGRCYRGEINHVPWPLQTAEAVIDINTMTQSLGLELPNVPPVLHFSRRIVADAWTLDRV